MYRLDPLWCYLCLVVAIFSCSSENQQQEMLTPDGKPLRKIEAVAEPDSKIASKDFFQEVDLIPLETSDSILIGGLQQVVYYKDEYYVADAKTQRLWVFDDNGKIRRGIGIKGNGPGEYENLRDFCIVPQKDELILYSSESLSLLTYSTSGDFKRRDKLEFFGSSFELLGKDQLIFYTNYNPSDASGTYNVLVTDMQGKVLKRTMPFPSSVEMSVGFSGGLRVFGENILYSNALSDTLWLLNKAGEKQKAFLFDFDGKEWKYGFDFRKLYESGSLDMSYVSAGYFMDEDFLFTAITDKRRRRQVIYAREQRQTFNEYSFNDSFMFKLIKTPTQKVGTDTYLTAINAQSYSGLKVSYPDEWNTFNQIYPTLAASLERMLENEENPMLIRFKIRR